MKRISKKTKSLMLSLKLNTDFPIYTAALMNLSNSTGNLTSKRNIGPLHEYFEEFKKKSREHKKLPFSVEGWRDFYLNDKNGQQFLDRAIDKNLENIEKFQDALKQVNKKLITDYIYDLVFKKTFIGLNFEYLATSVVARYYKIDYQKIKKANFQEESKGIDMWIDQIPVQIKPYNTYLSDSSKSLECELVIYYEKTSSSEIIVYFDEEKFAKYVH